MILNVILLLFLIPSFIGCTSTPKNFQHTQTGSWEARALIKDKVKSKKYIVNIDFIANRPSQLRMEVTSTIGQHLASFAMNDKTTSYLVTKEKKYYKGPLSSESMRSIIGHPFDARLIQNILFDEPIPTKDWSCTADKNGVVVECRGRDSMRIEWADREGKRRNVLVASNKFEIQLQFHNFEIPDPLDTALFEVTKPVGFR